MPAESMSGHNQVRRMQKNGNFLVAFEFGSFENRYSSYEHRCNQGAGLLMFAACGFPLPHILQEPCFSIKIPIPNKHE